MTEEVAQGKAPPSVLQKGELRDKSIEEKMDPSFRREDLVRIVRKAAKKR